MVTPHDKLNIIAHYTMGVTYVSQPPQFLECHCWCSMILSPV